jgi:hypothetical protein
MYLYGMHIGCLRQLRRSPTTLQSGVHGPKALSLDVDHVDQQTKKPQSRPDGRIWKNRTIAFVEKVYLKLLLASRSLRWYASVDLLTLSSHVTLPNSARQLQQYSEVPSHPFIVLFVSSERISSQSLLFHARACLSFQQVSTFNACQRDCRD